MPNWCYTEVCFRGEVQNISRLRKDIEKTMKWSKEHGRYFCNIRYFLYLNNFDTASYANRCINKFIPHLRDCNFRGSVYDYSIDLGEELTEYNVTFEMAWYTDYQLLQLISMIYDIKFSAYSSEEGMGIYDKCKNDDIDNYDFDYIIVPDYDQFESVLDEDPEGLDLDYNNPVKDGSIEAEEIISILNDYGIEYETRPIEVIPVPDIHGVYYQYLNGVIYDIENNKNFNYYPGIDPFNRPLFNGVYYD